MRILHVYKDYYPVLGGIENHVRVLAEAQTAAGHEVEVLACAVSGPTIMEERAGVKVVKARRLATLASMPISMAQPLRLALARPDIIHIHSPYPLGEATWLLLGRSKAAVMTHHSDIVRQKKILKIYGPILARVLAAVDAIVATSRAYISTSPWIGPHEAKSSVIPLGVDHRRFTPAHLADQDLDILFVGRLRYYKGLDTLIEALARLDGPALHLAGDGPMEESLRRTAEQYGVANRVIFMGRVPDEELPSLYRRAKVFALPANSRAEAFGTVLLEAMASGVPCLTTEVGTGTSWVVKHGETGFVVPPSAPATLSQALKELLRNPGLRERMGRTGRKRVEEVFTQERMVCDTLSLYERLLHTRKQL